MVFLYLENIVLIENIYDNGIYNYPIAFCVLK